MSAVNFREPISLFLGLGFPVEIPNAWEAYRILAEWPGTRDDTFDAALLASFKAINDEVSAEPARDAIEAFALARGILAAEAMRAATVRFAQEWMSA